ncbi:MAG TPA: redoxin domain-containing protein [Verrucomicrobiae bacterium]|nr:redoxin domain-containing protein [Verrucomicrobiae bacterium]
MNRWRFASITAALLALTGVLTVACSAQAQGARGLAPVLAATDWIGERPWAQSLAGDVVVLDVFTVDCYNCQNVVPALRTLYARDRARGLAVIGIHAPETPAERGRAYVIASLQRQGIVWPVAVDNGFRLWNAYGVTAWPTQLFFDRHGRLRATIVGDSQDAAVESTVERLLAEK